MGEVVTPTGQVVLLDVDDLARLNGRSVSIGSHGYAQIWEHPRVLLLHRWLLGLGVGDPRLGDHINGDKLDNRRENLRIVTPAESNLNRSVKGRGVYRTRNGKRWQAKVAHGRGGRATYLGTFDTADEAEAAVAAFRAEHGIVHTRFEGAT